MPAVDKPFKHNFEICYEGEDNKQVSKINLYKHEGSLSNPEDPLWKIIHDRAVNYGKGLGGGGGKYIPGITR